MYTIAQRSSSTHPQSNCLQSSTRQTQMPQVMTFAITPQTVWRLCGQGCNSDHRKHSINPFTFKATPTVLHSIAGSMFALELVLSRLAYKFTGGFLPWGACFSACLVPTTQIDIPSTIFRCRTRRIQATLFQEIYNRLHFLSQQPSNVLGIGQTELSFALGNDPEKKNCRSTTLQDYPFPKASVPLLFQPSITPTRCSVRRPMDGTRSQKWANPTLRVHKLPSSSASWFVTTGKTYFFRQASEKRDLCNYTLYRGLKPEEDLRWVMFICSPLSLLYSSAARCCCGYSTFRV
ncbi:hypothetical protein FA15DRAFT_368571 [Coprinopsis marcescibilis]|uniref:Uncharacterized protein n=1 Tax=Coprinopsis marcescibilis TaxID=230819 RepID=A0A5C3KZC2_COPMA|nr:hypothetical protein FA15DRAFT_368571 [Coprinopsis marcescibilis]